ncbi:MAG: type II toxin-antitoxin system CcdA family antitoxin, partial [Candidatus Micrarchaeia archaeon]
MKDTNVSVRIERELYEKARKMNINFSETFRNALMNEIENQRNQRIMKNLDKASEAVKRMGMKNIVADIRQMRE